MRTTGFYGSLVRLAAIMFPMFGLLVAAQTPVPPTATTPAPAQTAQPPQGRGAARCRPRPRPARIFRPSRRSRRGRRKNRRVVPLPPGYRMELVSPSRNYQPGSHSLRRQRPDVVAEFATYMRDADGNNQHTPESRITRFESTKGDGVYDKRTVFVDKLVLPRTIVPLDGNSILTNETASDDIVKYTDTNNDGVADKREHSTRASVSAATATSNTSKPDSSGVSTTGFTPCTTPFAFVKAIAVRIAISRKFGLDVTGFAESKEEKEEFNLPSIDN